GGTTITDMENEITFYSNLKKCNLDLKSQCLFYKEMNELFFGNKKGSFPQRQIDTYKIKGKIYPDFKLFDPTNMLEIEVKPSMEVQF
ncbi:MAG: hypothetical protein ACK5B9_02925, partial [Flavobacteriia bacterium]